MNSRQLQCAVMVAELRSFSQVAEKLNITQPALSKQILNLEKELQIRLFDRNNIPLTLTPAGEQFIQQAKELLYREDQLIRSMDRFRSGEAGRLTIGISPFRSLYLVSHMLKKVRDKYPGIQIVLHEANGEELRKEAAEGKFDFAIVNLPVDETLLDATPIEPDVLALAVPNEFVDKILNATIGEGKAISFEECKDLPFVVVKQSQEMRKLFDKLCVTANFHPQITTEVVGVATARALAYAGLGATLLPMQFAKSEHYEDKVTLFTVKDVPYSRQPVLITRRGQYISEYAQYAMDLLK